MSFWNQFVYKMTWPPTEQFQFTFTIENYNNNLSSTSRKYLTMAPKFGYWSIQGVSRRILLVLFFIILSFFKKQNWFESTTKLKSQRKMIKI